MNEQTLKSENTVITSDLVIPETARAVVVFGLYSGAGVSTVARFIRSRTSHHNPPPLVLERGILSDDKADLANRLAFAPLEEPDEARPPRLADVVVLLTHAQDIPLSALRVYQTIEEIYHETGLPAPHIISRYKGMGDYADAVMASKAEMTDRLLWLMAKAFFTADSPDYTLAKELYNGAAIDKEIEMSKKDIPNKL